MKFWGYERRDGQIGIRNHLLIMPLVQCVNFIAEAIANEIKDGATFYTGYGCCQVGNDAKQTRKTMLGFANNPNVGACIIVGMACSDINGDNFVNMLSQHKPVSYIELHDGDDPEELIALGCNKALEMQQCLNKMQRKECDLSSLIIGLECGGSDTWSGFSANPATGICSDLLIAEGGSAILSESQEMIGAEHLFAAKATDKYVRQRFIDIIKLREQESIDGGVDIASVNPSPGNKAGGLTTLEEKSLGCMQKGGENSPLVEVVDYAVKPLKSGLIFMDTPGDDVESITGLIAGGCQAIIFTTGRGTAVGCPIAPVIKVSSNTRLYKKMENNIDFDAGTIVDGKSSIKNCGQNLFNKLICVCNGELTKSEILHCDSTFSITRTGITL